MTSPGESLIRAPGVEPNWFTQHLGSLGLVNSQILGEAVPGAAPTIL
jgi:hypothetical protein